MTPDEQVRIVRRALGGQHLTGWWAEDWKAARSAVIAGKLGWSGANEYGEVRANGVHVWYGSRYEGPPPGLDERNFEARVRPADVVVTWREVHEIVTRGATPERRAAYQAAVKGYVEQMTAPLPHPHGRDPVEGWDYFTDPENVAHWQANSAAIGRLHEAADAIIEAGCAGSASFWRNSLVDLDTAVDELVEVASVASASWWRESVGDLDRLMGDLEEMAKDLSQP